MRQHVLRVSTAGWWVVSVPRAPGRMLGSPARAATCAAALVSFGAGEVRAEPAPGVPAPLRAAADAYTANAVVVIHVGKDSDGIDQKGSTWHPVRGLVYRFALDPPEFLDLVGRPDLAERERTRHATARTLSIVGDIIAPVGIIGALFTLGAHNKLVPVAFLGGGVGGIVIHEVGESMLKPGLRESEALRLADAYNQALRVRLGLPPLDAPERRPPRGAAGTLAFSVSALPLPRGGLAVLAVSY
jgi:hypothetical protein